jgi:hypothetical protein
VYSVENASLVVGSVPEKQLTSPIGKYFAEELSGARDGECVGEVPQQLYVPLKCSKTLQRLLCEQSSAYI